MFWGLFRDMERLRDEMSCLLDTSSWSNPGWRYSEGPAVNLYETPEEYVVVAEVPGADKKKFNVSLRGGALSIKGEYKAEPGGDECICGERPEGSFSRLVNLPGSVDGGKVDASFRDGYLKVRIPKAESSKAKQIEVKLS